MRVFYLLSFLLLGVLCVAQYPQVQQFNVTMNSYNVASIHWQAPEVASQTILYEGFEAGIIPNGWIVLDVDGDQNNWEMHPSSWSPAHSGNYSVASYSWFNGTALTPNNWLITPTMTLPNNASLNFWISAISSTYSHEHYQVRLSTGGTNTADFSVILHDETLPHNSNTWQNRTIDLTAFAGATVRLAFVHNNSTNVFAIKLDDITVGVFPKQKLTLTGYTLQRKLPNQSAFQNYRTFGTSENSFFDTLTVEGVISYRIIANYDDGGSSVPSQSASVMFYDWYPALNQSQIAAIASNELGLVLSIHNPNLFVEKTLLTESFKSPTDLSNWSLYDLDQDGEMWEKHTATAAYHGSQSMASYSWFNGNQLHPNNWAVSKAFPIYGGHSVILSWYVATLNQNYPGENYSLAVGQNPVNFTAFNVLFSERLTAQNISWQRRMVDLTQSQLDTASIAFIHHNSTNQFALKIDSVTLRTFNHVVGYKIYYSHHPDSNFQYLTQIVSSEAELTATLPLPATILSPFWIKIAVVYANGGESVVNNPVFVDFQNVGLPNDVVSALTINPNPASDRISVVFGNTFDTSGYLIITDINGRQWKKLFWEGNSLDVDLAQLPDGLYVLTIHTHQQQSRTKLIIQR